MQLDRDQFTAGRENSSTVDNDHTGSRYLILFLPFFKKFRIAAALPLSIPYAHYPILASVYHLFSIFREQMVVESGMWVLRS